MPVARRPKFSPSSLELLEGRTLLNGSQLARVAAAHPAAVTLLTASAIKTDPGAAAAITSALRGGIGSEWATLIRKQVRNPLAVVRSFSTNQASTYTVNGLTFRTPAAQPAFTGRAYDQLLPTAAGAAVFKRNVFELAAVMRGEFRNPETSYYVFALDRGAGARLGPTFASRPGITPDALVTITVGPYGSSASGTIRDLSDGSTQSIDPARIKIQGATLRVFLDTGQVPSRGAALAQYRFSMWTQTQPGSDLANVAGFAPDSTMVRIAVLKNVAARR
ncbi:hypothetical protein EP7_004889 [Isosphaeraceae bacterium EP7]